MGVLSEHVINYSVLVSALEDSVKLNKSLSAATQDPVTVVNSVMNTSGPAACDLP